jgi:hypothetical protein
MFRKALVAIGVVGMFTLAIVPSQAQAKDKPFKITGGGVAPNGFPLPGGGSSAHWAVGHATHLGKYHGEGAVQTDSASFLPDGTVIGEFGSAVPFEFTAANGDVLACYYGRTDFGAKQPGTFELIPVPEMGPGWYVAHWIAEFVPYDPDCTGKFKGTTGSWIMYAKSKPFVLGLTDPVEYSWHGDGSLHFPKCK